MVPNTSLTGDPPMAITPDSSGLRPYAVALRAVGRSPGGPSAADDVAALAARFGISVSFDDMGYSTTFEVIATCDLDAETTARRRWFYLAHDLGLPGWPVTDVVVTPR